MAIPDIEFLTPQFGAIQEYIERLKAMEDIIPVMSFKDKINGTVFIRYDKDGQFAGSIFQDKNGTVVTIGNEICSVMDEQEVECCAEHQR